MRPTASVTHRLYRSAAVPSYLRFRRALSDPQRAQLSILRRILKQNATTSFGSDHRFDAIDSAESFRTRVPVRGYDDYAPYVDRVAAGEARVLTVQPVRFFEPTGGSSGAVKLIPFTDALRREFSAATMPWIGDLLRTRPQLRDGRAYWAITPFGSHPRTTSGGIPIGLDHDSDYFPRAVRSLLETTLAVPGEVAGVPDLQACRYLTLRALIAAPDLALVSVWSPSFLTLLSEALDEHFEALLADLADGELSVDLPADLARGLRRRLPAMPARAKELAVRFGSTAPHDLGAMWPGLTLISCWADGHAVRALRRMRERWPNIEVQPKGLLATEGVVSFPLTGAPAPVAAVTSHFLEFIDDSGRVFLAHQLTAGATYEVLLTTGGGLYRYRLSDLVRVEGHLRRTPLLRFVGRADGAVDLAGEKLTPAFVEGVVTDAARRLGLEPGFAMLSPSEAEPAGYVLHAELPGPAGQHDAARFAALVDELLCDAHHYALCRALGQLAPVRGVAVIDAERTYHASLARAGRRAGAIKLIPLDGDPSWNSHFVVKEETTA